jgi:hypothetical protein
VFVDGLGTIGHRPGAKLFYSNHSTGTKKPEVKKYSEDQPRADDGKFGEGGGSASSKEPSSGKGGGSTNYEGSAFSDPSATPEQATAFKQFQDAGYVPINGALREGGKVKPSVKAAIKEMDGVA